MDVILIPPSFDCHPRDAFKENFFCIHHIFFQKSLMRYENIINLIIGMN
jgi:hypothetical protein